MSVRAATKALFQEGDTIEVRAWGKSGNKYVGRYTNSTRCASS